MLADSSKRRVCAEILQHFPEVAFVLQAQTGLHSSPNGRPGNGTLHGSPRPRYPVPDEGRESPPTTSRSGVGARERPISVAHAERQSGRLSCAHQSQQRVLRQNGEMVAPNFQFTAQINQQCNGKYPHCSRASTISVIGLKKPFCDFP